MTKALDTAEWIFHYLVHHNPDTPCPENCKICALEKQSDRQTTE